MADEQMIRIPLELAQAAYVMAYRLEDVAVSIGHHDGVAEAALVASDLLDAISEQAGPLAAEECIPRFRRGVNPPLDR